MSKLAEIEAAAAALSAPEKAELLRFIAKALREEEAVSSGPRHGLIAKWRAAATGMIVQHGGTQGYLDAIRGRDEDGR